jgi:hypothetical protein
MFNFCKPLSRAESFNAIQDENFIFEGKKLICSRNFLGMLGMTGYFYILSTSKNYISIHFNTFPLKTGMVNLSGNAESIIL